MQSEQLQVLSVLTPVIAMTTDCVAEEVKVELHGLLGGHEHQHLASLAAELAHTSNMRSLSGL